MYMFHTHAHSMSTDARWPNAKTVGDEVECVAVTDAKVPSCKLLRVSLIARLNPLFPAKLQVGA